MVPWGAILKDEQLLGLVAYLRSLQPVDPIELDESKLEGDPARGELIFRNIWS